MTLHKKAITAEMNIDTTTVRQLLKAFNDQDMTLVGFVCAHKRGTVELSLMGHIDDETALHIMAALAINCERAVGEAAVKVTFNPSRKDPGSN
ncbi:MAG: hypothetical protein V3S55_13370 [Nitrospiraceae bacterium]